MKVVQKIRDYFVQKRSRPAGQTLSSKARGHSAAPLIRHIAPMPPVCPKGVISDHPRGECEIAGRRYAYELQVGFETLDGTSPRHAGIRGWALDLDSNTPGPILCVTTETGGTVRFKPDQPRGDALRVMAIPKERHSAAMRCGFSGIVPDAGSKVTFALEVGDQSVTVATGRPDRPQIIAGWENWLFLTGDSNDSPEQFTGDHQPSAAWLSGWDAYFDALRELSGSGTAGRLCFVIAPSKESIFPDYYPLARGPRSPLDSLMERYGTVPELFYPVSVLSAQRELSYDRSETHWTHFGARLVCQEITHRFGKHNAPLPQSFGLSYVAGDLGWKAIPPVRTYRPIAIWPNGSKVIFDNFVLHHGRIRVTVNPKPQRKQTYVIFGGSSAEHMEHYLTAIYARVVYVYSAGAPDPAILAYERPDFTILQSSERFLIRAPEPEVNNAEIVARKLRAGLVTRSEPREELLAQWTDPSVAIYRNMG